MLSKELLQKILSKPEITPLIIESSNQSFHGQEIGILPKTIGMEMEFQEIMLKMRDVGEDDAQGQLKAYRNYNLAVFSGHVCDENGDLLFDKDTVMQVPSDVIEFVVGKISEIGGSVTDEEMEKQAKK